MSFSVIPQALHQFNTMTFFVTSCRQGEKTYSNTATRSSKITTNPWIFSRAHMGGPLWEQLCYLDRFLTKFALFLQHRWPYIFINSLVITRRLPIPWRLLIFELLQPSVWPENEVAKQIPSLSTLYPSWYVAHIVI